MTHVPRGGLPMLQHPAAVRSTEPRPRAKALLRRYEAACLDENGHLIEINRLAPAIPFFESAFSAMARSTLITTPAGPVAVEDLMPGDLIETAEDGPQPLLWKGTLTLYPQRRDMSGRADRLLRMTADALGYGRPLQDLLLGPDARIWSPRAADFLRAEDLVDGEAVIELTPIAPVTAFHLCLPGCHTLLANGVALRSYAPDPAQTSALSADLLALFLSMFPNRTLLQEIGPPRRARGPASPKNGIAAA
ncbi:MAG: hypothetical protein GC186_12135 [Rhodobacteraceae bacterium]|nr:hypothetical protein [Paracoccaceae bacterium]